MILRVTGCSSRQNLTLADSLGFLKKTSNTVIDLAAAQRKKRIKCILTAMAMVLYWWILTRDISSYPAIDFLVAGGRAHLVVETPITNVSLEELGHDSDADP